MTRSSVLLPFALACALLSAACSSRTKSVEGQAGTNAATSKQVAIDPADALEESRLAPLRAYERELRAKLDPQTMPSSEVALGADPWAIKPLLNPRGKARYVGILRGRSAVVLLGEDLTEIARAPAPRSTTGLTILSDGTIAVAGELSRDVAFYSAARDTLTAAGTIATKGEGIRDLAATGTAALAALDSRGAHIHFIAGRLPSSPRLALPTVATCRGGAQLTATKTALVVTCSTDHAIDVIPLSAAGTPRPGTAPIRITTDGPFFGAAAAADGDAVTIAAGGLEDRKLDRTQGSFGFIDSFVHVYRVTLAGGVPARVRSVNLSELGVVTPKALAIAGANLRVIGYGTTDLVSIALDEGRETRRIPALPGARTIEIGSARVVFANPLFDSWMTLDERTQKVELVRVPDIAPPAMPPRSIASRVGEALVFTTLMAPWNKAEGRLSRFTCETCHFEGTVDGRTHHTGRENIHATTKPILGLFNNRPHFSRALDPDLAVLSMNEFRAANAKSDHEAYFSLDVALAPWVSRLEAAPSDLSAEGLRRAFMAFLTDFTHRPNGRAIARSTFTPEERRGAEVFRDRCARCHGPKLSADAETAIPYPEWERFIFTSAGALVWADARYEKTGVVPYVNERGARVPSLRRTFLKRPYFTNGSAPDLDDVLARVRDFGGSFLHDGPASHAGALSPEERRTLRTFLEVL